MPRLMTVLLVLVSPVVAQGQGPHPVSGRVVDAAGRPVAGATVDNFWRANGPCRDPAGQPFDLTKPEVLRNFWGNLGVMEALHTLPAVKTGADGRFTLPSPAPYAAIMALDSARERGGVVLMPRPGDDAPVEIRLAPLALVHGSLQGPNPSQAPEWTHVYVHVPEHPTRPVDSTRLVSCGSFEAKFAFRVPPGRYHLQGYSTRDGVEGHEGETLPNPEFTVEPGQTDLDLGRLTLSPPPPGFREKQAESVAAKRWRDHGKHLGEMAPTWTASDARGLPKSDPLGKLRGKWVLLDFWGLSCRPCITQDIPALVRFYDEHAAQRDRFEIVSVFLDDDDGKVATMADFDRALAPIVAHVWRGRPLPFPVVVDATFQTWERFGVTGFGLKILVDPDGRMVPGDEATLAEKLREPAKRP